MNCLHACWNNDNFDHISVAQYSHNVTGTRHRIPVAEADVRLLTKRYISRWRGCAQYTQ